MRFKNSVIAALLGLTLLGCKTRKSVLANAPSDISFTNPTVVQMASSARSSEKRKFADFTGDRIEDMAEVRDTKLFGQDYKMTVFPGVYKNGILTFVNAPQVMNLELKKHFWSIATKIDSADVNGDAFADLVFTRYHDGWTKDEFFADLAINTCEGDFRYVEVRGEDDLPLSSLVLSAITYNHAVYGYYSAESIDDYFMMDWADANGDGKDDLFLLWKGKRSNLNISIYLVEETDDKKIILGQKQEVQLPSFMLHREMYHVDTEDFNGDDLADICVYQPVMGNRLCLSVALGKKQANGKLTYIPQKDVIVKDTKMRVWTNLAKYDSFDANQDGKADIAHIGIIHGQPSISYNFAVTK